MDAVIPDFRWIEDLLTFQPKTRERRKNAFEIAGYPNYESVISNVLAFFLDETEEHNLNRLFLDSLLECYKDSLGKEESNEQLESLQKELGAFTVHKEFPIEGLYLDLLLHNEQEEPADEKEETFGWAILIENKWFADLYNNLEAYWKGVRAKHKVGIVLSIKELQKNKNLQNSAFINITHKQLIEKVKSKLPDYYMDGSDWHLLFLKDFINNVMQKYMDPSTITELEKGIKAYRKAVENITELQIFEQSIRTYVVKQAIEAFRSIGFNPSSEDKKVKTKIFTPDESEYGNTGKPFRFWVNFEPYLKEGRFEAYFELSGRQYTQNGALIREYIKSDFEGKRIKIGTGGSEKVIYMHLISINVYQPDGDTDTYEFLKKLLEDEVKPVVVKCMNAYSEINKP